MNYRLVLGVFIAVLVLVVWGGFYIQGDRQVPSSLAIASKPVAVVVENKTASRQSAESITPESALRSALTNKDARSVLLEQWAETIETNRIAALLEEINANLSPEDARPEVRQALLASWSKRDKAGLGEWFGARYAADELHQESRDALLRILNQEEPAAAFSWMQSALPDSAREELCEPFLRHWAKGAPAEASVQVYELARTESANPRWSYLLGQVVGEWAEQDLVSAVTWTRSLSSGLAKSKAIEELSYRWSKIDPEAAGTFAATQNEPAALEAVANVWAAGDPERAHSWALELPEGEGRHRAVAAATAIWAVQAPASAAKYVDMLPAGESRNQARIVVAARWAESESIKAAEWIERFPENSAREQAAAQVVMAWAVRDPHEAGRWLGQLPQSRSRDAAVLAYCGVIEASEPASAFAWAECISDTPLRQQRQEQSASRWLAQNPAAARQGIASSTLPEDLKKQLLHRSY